jgi:hypothetical protein
MFLWVEYLPGDEFGDVCRISLAPESGQDFDQVPIPGPGGYEVTWRRYAQWIFLFRVKMTVAQNHE